MTVRAASSQAASQATTRSTRTRLTMTGECPERPRRNAIGPAARAGDAASPAGVAAWAGRSVRSSNTGGSSGTGDLHFLAKAVPHAAVQLGELGRQPDLLDPAGPGQVDGDDVLDGGRPGGHDHHAVG